MITTNISLNFSSTHRKSYPHVEEPGARFSKVPKTFRVRKAVCKTPERRTKRCSPRFRPSDRFSGLSFRYQSPNTDGEKRRSLGSYVTDPFNSFSSFHNKQFLDMYKGALVLSFIWYLRVCSFDICARALKETLISRFRAIIAVLFCSCGTFVRAKG